MQLLQLIPILYKMYKKKKKNVQTAALIFYVIGNIRLGVDDQFLHEMRSIECQKKVIYD